LLCVRQSMSFPTHAVTLSTMLQGKQGKSVDPIKAAQQARVVINIMRAEQGDSSVWTGCSWVWHWAKNAKNNWKAATQGECPSHKPRILLVKSCVPPFYWSSNSRNEWQALITVSSIYFLGQYLLPTKRTSNKMFAATRTIWPTRESTTTRCCGGKQSSCIQLENDQ